MSFDYDALDIGVRDVVRRLHEQGFETTDSGDGRSKPPEQREMDFPHVAVAVQPELMIPEAHRLQAHLGPSWCVEATYWPQSGYALLLATSEK